MTMEDWEALADATDAVEAAQAPADDDAWNEPEQPDWDNPARVAAAADGGVDGVPERWDVGGETPGAATTDDDEAAPRRPPSPFPDRPVLLVNWTALTGGAVTRQRLLEDLVDHDAWDALREQILADFNIQSELLFQRNLARHSTELRWEADAERLAELFPDDYYSALPYPSTVADGVVDVDEAWADILRPSEFAVVTAVKQALGQSSNTLLWKALMATELEELAAWQKAQPRARAERAAGAAASGTAAAKPAAAASPEFDVSRLNVLDRILAMIFDRWPRYTDDEAAHTAEAAKRHLILKQMWIREFGGLPDL